MKFQRKFNLDENVFESIDTEEKAYWLGFIAADGCVYEKTRSLLFNINKKDIYHLCKLQKLLKSNHVLHENNDNTYKLQITSQKLCNDLLKYGITPRKSLTLDVNLDLIPTELHRHFWRGMIDGDGTLILNDDKVFGLVGTNIMCDKLKKFCINFGLSSKSNVRKDRNVFRYYITGGQNFKFLCNLFYKNCNIYLCRKYEIALKYF